jgi:hypothetical protein
MTLSATERDAADDHAERRRLSGPVRPEQAHDLAPTDLEVDASNDLLAVVDLVEVLGAQPLLAHGRASPGCASDWI